ncbi:MAG: hypothetical protein ACM3NO_00815 [Deltaproteobacteria bacterium]
MNRAKNSRRLTPPRYRRRRRRHQQYRSTALVNVYEAKHPGLRVFIEELLRHRCSQEEISRRVKKRFGVSISRAAISRFYVTEIRPAEHAEAEAYRQARGQARALLEEMKADPKLDAAQIAELMLAQAIVRDRTKLAEADIMELYKEQRERKKLELQSKALRLREKQTKAVLAKAQKPKEPELTGPELAAKIQEIYGLTDPPPSPAAAT